MSVLNRGIAMLDSVDHSHSSGINDVFAPGSIILFQGDSITDGNRGRNADPNHILGHGYAFLIAARFGNLYAGRNLTFINRGISGNTVADLTRRWDVDTLALQPNLISILIGINDLMTRVSASDYETDFDALLYRTRDELPAVKLVLIEPFYLAVGTKFGDLAKMAREMSERREAIRRLATKHSARVVPAQSAFDEACNRAKPEHWIWDGVHPTYSGHQVLADAWIRAVSDP